MLEIVRGRTWSVAHTVLDSADGPESDLSEFLVPTAQAKCEIRQRVATPLRNGDFLHDPVVEPSVALSSVSPHITISLDREATAKLRVGLYDIDVVLTNGSGDDWTAIPVEPIKVVDRPTQP